MTVSAVTVKPDIILALVTKNTSKEKEYFVCSCYFFNALNIQKTK